MSGENIMEKRTLNSVLEISQEIHSERQAIRRKFKNMTPQEVSEWFDSLEADRYFNYIQHCENRIRRIKNAY